MLSEEHARHFLSDSEREAFERDGFIVLGGVLEPHEVAEYTQLVDTIYEEQMTAEVDPHTTGLFGSDQPFFYPNILCRNQRFVDLLDHPRVFPKVLGILGWNIYAYHSHPHRDPTRIHGTLRIPRGQWTCKLRYGGKTGAAIDGEGGLLAE